MAKFNHMFTIAFSFDTENEGASVTAEELFKGLRQRLRDLEQSQLRGSNEIIEACGLPCDTYRQCDAHVDAMDKLADRVRASLAGGDKITAIMLISEGVAAEKRAGYERTPLMWAVEQNLSEAVATLLDMGAKVNEQNNFGNSALHLAVMAETINHDILHRLVDAGADAQLDNQQERTPTAIFEDRPENEEAQPLVTYLRALRATAAHGELSAAFDDLPDGRAPKKKSGLAL